MKRAVVLLCAVLTGAVVSAAGRDLTPALQEKMKTFQLVLLKKGSAPLDPKVLEAHRDYMMKLGADGASVAAGPFTDGGEIAGAMILRASTVEAAKKVESDDPAVRAGLFTVEVLPFMSTDEGQFQPWATPFAQETVYFGFLISGPNRSQDKEEAQRLQKEHLAYMDGQWKQGGLFVAGPFVDAGTRRGIVIYRAASSQEAKERAEGDPAVKLGRLAVELHPWAIPKGALK